MIDIDPETLRLYHVVDHTKGDLIGWKIESRDRAYSYGDIIRMKGSDQPLGDAHRLVKNILDAIVNGTEPLTEGSAPSARDV